MSLNMTFPMTLDDGTINGEPVSRSYMAEALTAKAAAEITGQLTVSGWRLLLAATRSGLPVILTLRQRDATSKRARMTVLVKHLTALESGGRMRVSYWGFDHEICISDVERVELPGIEYVRD